MCFGCFYFYHSDSICHFVHIPIFRIWLFKAQKVHILIYRIWLFRVQKAHILIF